jgi:hypothetical protein
MSNGMHIHIIDNKQVSFPNNNCPICGTAVPQPQAGAKIPNVHRKGNTVVLQITKLQMGTVTWYQKGNALLMSLRKASRDNQGKLLRGQDGRPLWNQITIRVTIPLMKEFTAEISKLMSDIESTPTYTQSTVPQRG